MSYTEGIARLLIDNLSKTAGLPTFQLAGHVPNLPFWMHEVRHALDTIAGYPQRHMKMVQAQAEFDVNYPDKAKSRAGHEYQYQQTRLAVSPALAERLNRELLAATERIIKRCLEENLIDLVTADDLRAATGRNDPTPN